jgi:hypothetical protein
MADGAPGGGSRQGNFFIGNRLRLNIQSANPTSTTLGGLPDSSHVDIFTKSDGIYYINSAGTVVKLNDASTASAGSFTTLAASGAITGATTLAMTGAATFASTVTVTGLTTLGSWKGTVDLGGAVIALTSSSTIALNSTLGNIFTLVPAHTATINCATVPATGQEITLRILTSGTSSFTLTFGTNFKSTGTLATGTADAKVFVIKFVSDGTNMNEVSRTTAM